MTTKLTSAYYLTAGQIINFHGKLLTITKVELGAEKDWVHVTGDPSISKIATTGGLEVVTQ